MFVCVCACVCVCVCVCVLLSTHNTFTVPCSDTRRGVCCQSVWISDSEDQAFCSEVEDTKYGGQSCRTMLYDNWAGMTNIDQNEMKTCSNSLDRKSSLAQHKKSNLQTCSSRLDLVQHKAIAVAVKSGRGNGRKWCDWCQAVHHYKTACGLHAAVPSMTTAMARSDQEESDKDMDDKQAASVSR